MASRRDGVCFALVGALSLLWATSASAQDARALESAANAFDRGTDAMLANDYARAAEWFETANRLAPASAALMQAIRAHDRAGNQLRAATLALRLESLYPDDREAAQAAREAIRHGSRFVRVDVECDECSVTLGGALVEHPSFFVQPGVSHTVGASFETGTVTREVQGQAGARERITFEAPPPSEGQDPDRTETQESRDATPTSPFDDPPRTRTESGGGIGVIPPVVTVIAWIAAAGLGATLTWSTIDALDGVPAYEENPTPEGLADGQGREERTSWLLGGTIAMGVVALLFTIFTDFGGGDDEPDVQVSFGIQADGAGAGLRGRF